MRGTRRQHKNTKLLFKSWELAGDYEVTEAMDTLDKIKPSVDTRTRIRHFFHSPGIFDATPDNPEQHEYMDYEPWA